MFEIHLETMSKTSESKTVSVKSEEFFLRIIINCKWSQDTASAHFILYPSGFYPLCL